MTRERERLANAQELVAFTTEGANRLYDEEGSVVEQLGKLLKEAQNWAAVGHRSAGIFSSARSTAAAMCAGTVSRVARTPRGLSVSTRAMIPCAVDAVCGGSPVSIS